MIKYLGSKLATGSSLLALGSSLKAIKSLHQKKLYRFINGTIGGSTATETEQEGKTDLWMDHLCWQYSWKHPRKGNRKSNFKDEKQSGT